MVILLGIIFSKGIITGVLNTNWESGGNKYCFSFTPLLPLNRGLKECVFYNDPLFTACVPLAGEGELKGVRRIASLRSQ